MPTTKNTKKSPKLNAQTGSHGFFMNDKGWTSLPHEYFEYLPQLDIKGSREIILTRLIKFAGSNNRARPTIADLQRSSGLDRKTIIAALRWLKEHEFIIVTPRYREGTKKKRASHYDVMPFWKKLAAVAFPAIEPTESVAQPSPLTICASPSEEPDREREQREYERKTKETEAFVRKYKNDVGSNQHVRGVNYIRAFNLRVEQLVAKGYAIEAARQQVDKEAPGEREYKFGFDRDEWVARVLLAAAA